MVKLWIFINSRALLLPIYFALMMTAVLDVSFSYNFASDCKTKCSCVVFAQPFVKRFKLCYRTIIWPVLSVWDVDVLCPNGWMDQDGTWHGGRPRPRPHCVRWGSIPPTREAASSPQFSAHVCCGQTSGYIKMPLSREVGLTPGDIMLDGDPAAP